MPSKTFNIKSRVYICVWKNYIEKQFYKKNVHVHVQLQLVYNIWSCTEQSIYMESVNTSENKRKSKEQLRDVNNIFNPRCESFVRQGKWGCFFCDKNNYVRVFHTICKSWHDLDCNVTVYISLNWDVGIPKKLFDTSFFTLS